MSVNAPFIVPSITPSVFPNASSLFGKSLEPKWKYSSYCHSSRWGPQSRMDPSLPKECSGGAVSEQARSV